MTDESAHDRMETYEELAAQERTFRRRKSDVLGDVGTDLADAIEAAANETSVTVEVDRASTDGSQQTLRARLDNAALVAAATDNLPDGFVVEHVNDDGSLTIQWDERNSTSESRRAGAILKAIVAEETHTDTDGLITEVPTREEVLTRAADLGVDPDVAKQRLTHLADLDVVDVAEDEVFPDRNFSKF